MLSRSVVSDSATPWTVACQAPLVHGDSPGNNTGVGCHAHLQGLSPTRRLNPSLPHCRRILYHLSHQGSCGKTLTVIKYKWWRYRAHCAVYLPVCLKFFIIEQFWCWSTRKCFFRGIRTWFLFFFFLRWFFREIPTEWKREGRFKYVHGAKWKWV